jgi:hypothetical protein
VGRAGGSAGLEMANEGSCAQPAKELNGDRGETMGRHGRTWEDMGRREKNTGRHGKDMVETW